MAEDIPFEVPPFLQNQEVETIHARMMNTLPNDIDKGEGGFPWDFTRPTAMEKAEFAEYNLVNTVRGIFARFCDPYLLDYHADANGIKRRPAQAAKAVLQLSGKPGTEIPAGFAVSTAAAYNSPSVTFRTDSAVTLSSDPVSVTITAVQAGAAGNVGSNTILIVNTPITGLATITNPSPAIGGVDQEDDETLRARVVEYEQTQGVSYVGSKSDYRRWALEVVGVGTVQVEGGEEGDCTIKLMLTGTDGNPASDEVCQNVYNHIMRPDDDSQRLAGVNDLLIVKPATKVEIRISVTVQLDGTVLLDAVKKEFQIRVEQYYHSEYNTSSWQSQVQQQGSGWKVRYTEIGAALLACSGVVDYENLLVNDGIENIPIAAGEIPVSTESDISLLEGTVT